MDKELRSLGEPCRRADDNKIAGKRRRLRFPLPGAGSCGMGSQATSAVLVAAIQLMGLEPKAIRQINRGQSRHY